MLSQQSSTDWSRYSLFGPQLTWGDKETVVKAVGGWYLQSTPLTSHLITNTVPMLQQTNNVG